MSRGATWTDVQRKAALDIWRQSGAAAAAKRTGIPLGTIRRWAAETGERAYRPERTRNAIEANRLKWEERRTSMVHDIGEVADVALKRCKEGLEDGKSRDAQAAATTLAILIDKAQLLSGGATSRPNIDPGALLSEAKGKVAQLVPMRKVG